MPALREALFAGEYNLLLGSGVTLDAKDSAGEFLRGAEQLRKDLLALTREPPATSLQRVYGLLTSDQVRTQITDRYSGCVPGPGLRNLPKYLWRRLFTFNVDDVFDNLYATTPFTMQTAEMFNFNTPLEPTP